MSSDLNSVILIGRLTRDAELSYLPSGSAVAKMSIAVNRSRREGEQWVNEVNYFDISLFGKQAESLKAYLLKGKQIAVQGSLRQDRWEKDGQKFSKVNVIANSVELLGGRSDGGSFGGGAAPSGQSSGGYQMRPNYGQQSGSAQGSYDSPDAGESFGGDGIDFPEDIPF
ncbi:MAG: single-stranded DNA-binding protein [Treponema sp.]|nr:single-stranded DNA-binding protein [Treponema sp.]MBP5752269.1 single-stranded DNA-binding protein [Treponema sp.]MBR4006034.1 single-stranded DNA-binding protein [Treponema sp.]